MSETEIRLTEHERNALQEIAQQSGKTESDLIHEAVNHFIREFHKKDRLMFMQKAKGIWESRTDLPRLEALRRGWDRD